jgi:hypothetical protein
MEQNVDESLIEATIRRVAEAQAAREDDGPEELEAASDDAEDEDVAAPALQSAGAEEPPVRTGSLAAFMTGTPVGSGDADESAIEAAIRRVAEAKAQRDLEAEAPEAQAAAGIETVETSAETHAWPPAADPEPLSFTQRAHGATALAFDPTPEPEAWTDAVARLERGLESAHTLLREIIARLDAGAVVGATAANSTTAFAPSRPAASVDEWEDEAPLVQNLGFGVPPRPSILRDPPAAIERAVEPDVIDTRPLPEPLPPIQTETRRGFDLLPRSYRITVEDKRRGVDLVPLHRALLAMDGVRDMSLLSYNNGVAIVSLETVNDIDTGVLESAVSRAMSRPATVEQHNERTLVVKLAEG